MAGVGCNCFWGVNICNQAPNKKRIGIQHYQFAEINCSWEYSWSRNAFVFGSSHTSVRKHKEMVETEKNRKACNFSPLLLWFHVSLLSCLTPLTPRDLELSQLFYSLPIGRITSSLQSEQQSLLIFPFFNVRFHLFKKFLTPASPL